ncbi:hydrolase 1, exosortase A system-associated [Propionivibrio sp.]|uniref:hydrolase 1, exosortase A system-associated n=1 Tax=Propionivibrio sp. TaxID=2212460 RepID=UPI0025D41065|nr:hydrolase 1, exosortase A system-associated [Propionivibrio sp.]
MNYAEQAVVFPVGGEQLLGIVATPDTPIDCGVLIVVGGPQYRVGSHRQFLLLTRRLAAEAYPTMRFDYRGMGDSDGAMRNFEEVTDDIGAALDTFQSSCPTIRRVVLWGLCDAASSALLYVQATRDSRIAGLVLLNPWVRSEASLAQTHIKHYYGQRLLQREFWIKLLSGKLSLFQSVRGLVTSALKARGTSDHAEGEITFFSGSYGRRVEAIFWPSAADTERGGLHGQGVSRICGCKRRVGGSPRHRPNQPSRATRCRPYLLGTSTAFESRGCHARLAGITGALIRYRRRPRHWAWRKASCGGTCN